MNNFQVRELARNIRIQMFTWQSVLSLVSVTAALLAAGFAWRQAEISEQALKVPYLANLNSRQIDVCTNLLYRSGDAQSSLLSWTNAARGHWPKGLEMPNLDTLQMSARETLLELGPSIEQAKLLADTVTRGDLSSLSSARAAFLLETLNNKPFSKSSEDEWMVQYDRAMSAVASKCRDVIRGEKQGLL